MVRTYIEYTVTAEDQALARLHRLRPARRGPTVAPTPEAVAAREAADAARLVSPRDAAIARLPANIDPASPAATELINFLEEQSWPEAHTEYPVYLHGRSVTEHEAMLEASLQRMIARNAAAPPVDEEDDQEDGEVDEEEPDERDVTIDQLQSALRAREDTLTAVRAQLTALEASHGAVGAGVSRAGIPSLAAPALSPQPSRLPAMHYRNTVASLFDSGRLARHAPADAAAPQTAGLQEAGPQPAGPAGNGSSAAQPVMTNAARTTAAAASAARVAFTAAPATVAQGTRAFGGVTIAPRKASLHDDLDLQPRNLCLSQPRSHTDSFIASAAPQRYAATLAASVTNAAMQLSLLVQVVQSQYKEPARRIAQHGAPRRKRSLLSGARSLRSLLAVPAAPAALVALGLLVLTLLRLRRRCQSSGATTPLAPASPALALVPAVAVLAVVEVVVVVAVLLVPPRASRWLRNGGRAVVAMVMADGSASTSPGNPSDTDNPHIPAAIKAELQALLNEYSDVFEPITSTPPERPVGHTIPLVPDSRPPVTPMYRLSRPEQEELKKQIKDYLAKGMIEPSSSPYAAPILFVQKKSGELRMCIDYRQLNKLTLRDQYPLPRIDDLFDRLSGCSVFSSLDLQSGYHQIRITPEDVPKTAFRTPEGHFQFKVLSFGLTNAPATFQRVMNDAFAPVLGKCALVYLDDILVMSKSLPDHMQHLRLVFDLLRANKLFAKMSKCEFMQLTLKFLGHVITAGAISVDPDKVRAIADWPLPSSLTQLQSFLGAANFVRKFVQGFSAISAPLTDLCGKLSATFPWHSWPDTERLAFHELKSAVANVPMLRLPDHTQPFQVYCDASLQGVGAVLMQDGYPLAYLSKKLSSAEVNYTTGHVGINKTLERVSRVFWWNTMRADVRYYVSTCDACQRDKASTLKPGGLLNPLSIPDYRWESVSMDFITKLPSGSHGYDAICVFVDRLSKMVHFVPCREDLKARRFAQLFIDHVYKLHGMPAELISDRGSLFTSVF
ncbi:hypothetical protein QJQ45_007584 [Haematococcus lacustris]|nr:hypothetical protein QJQ45_007584 [Haematococcus lacustris]